MSDQQQPVDWSWQCTACGRDVCGRIRAVLRIPFASLMAPLPGDLARCKALCPHCAEAPPEPDEVEPLAFMHRDGGPGDG